MTGRGYQEGFYNLCQSVREPASRQRQAEKIAYALTHYVDRDLSSLVCLDIGCSSGIITSALAPLFLRTAGLEYDDVALRAADVAARARVQFLRGDAMCLPFGDSAVDVIICAQVYEHVPDAKRLFAEMYRVLRPGGLAFFSGPNWLFPIEPHYSLPLLHWLPGPLADRYLRLAGRGEHYYERLHHLWALRKLVQPFAVHDVTIAQLQRFYLSRGWLRLFRSVPTTLWRALLPLLPTYNWILLKVEPAPHNPPRSRPLSTLKAMLRR